MKLKLVAIFDINHWAAAFKSKTKSSNYMLSMDYLRSEAYSSHKNDHTNFSQVKKIEGGFHTNVFQLMWQVSDSVADFTFLFSTIN